MLVINSQFIQIRTYLQQDIFINEKVKGHGHAPGENRRNEPTCA